jgi:membrane protease YdiL (CAAX protease family)
MSNLTKMLLVLVITVVIPLAVLLGIWADILPQSLQVAIGLAGVALTIAYIIGGNLMLMWGDIKSGRYSNKS